MANFYISDLHIGHENILRFDNRPFADVNEMNNKLIENWNARVRSDDTVYMTTRPGEGKFARGRD